MLLCNDIRTIFLQTLIRRVTGCVWKPWDNQMYISKQWTILLKEAASLLWDFYHDPLRYLTLLSLNPILDGVWAHPILDGGGGKKAPLC